MFEDSCLLVALGAIFGWAFSVIRFVPDFDGCILNILIGALLGSLANIALVSYAFYKEYKEDMEEESYESDRTSR